MVSTNEKTTAGMKHWKAAWLNANRLYKGLRANLWKLTQLLNEIFDDAEFRADNGLRDDLAAADWIDSKLPELPIGYMELRTILAYYPDKASWEGTKLSKLRDSIKPTARSKPAKPRAAKQDVAQFKREAEFYKAKAKTLERKVAEQTVKQETELPKHVAQNPGIVHAQALLTMIEAGLDHEDAELMSLLERLQAALESILQPMAV
jgi:hypothetical protein